MYPHVVLLAISYLQTPNPIATQKFYPYVGARADNVVYHVHSTLAKRVQRLMVFEHPLSVDIFIKYRASFHAVGDHNMYQLKYQHHSHGTCACIIPTFAQCFTVCARLSKLDDDNEVTDDQSHHLKQNVIK